MLDKKKDIWYNTEENIDHTEIIFILKNIYSDTFGFQSDILISLWFS